MSTSVLISIATFGVIGCAILAARGFRGRVDTIGVDLGTTFSVVGVKSGGTVTIVEDAKGRVLFPSVVAFLENGEDVLVGYDALPRLHSHPQSTIFNSKRFIGRSWDEECTQTYGQAHPYLLAQCDASISNFSSVAFDIPLPTVRGAEEGERPLSSSTSARLNHILVAPEAIGTHILNHLKAVTATFLGHSQVSKAVIAVPAKFTSHQRAATGAAYKAAGLKVVRVIEEPTAAAVAYKLHTKSNVHHILVYDFGGGTLDVSILYVAKGAVSVYATDGDDDLGGSDFDQCLSEALSSKVAEEITDNAHQTDMLLAQLSSGKSENQVSQYLSTHLNTSFAALCSAPSIRQKSEDIKKALTWNSTVTFTCDALLSASSSNSVIQVEKVSFSVTKEFFESTCQGLFERSLVPVTRLLEELEMGRGEIDEVVLVGGSTRIPRVKQQLREYFNNLELNDRIDPDVTVAYGAASILD